MESKGHTTDLPSRHYLSRNEHSKAAQNHLLCKSLCDLRLLRKDPSAFAILLFDR